MGFPASVADDVLVRCNRHCCLCGKYVGQKIELHHIKQVADGGEDTADNCIPLCFNCHAENDLISYTRLLSEMAKGEDLTAISFVENNPV